VDEAEFRVAEQFAHDEGRDHAGSRDECEQIVLEGGTGKRAARRDETQ
jgi:hypothetical protein